MVIAVLILAAVVFIGYACWAKKQADERRATLVALAAQNALEFSRYDRWDLGARYNGVADIGRGHNHYAEEVLIGGHPSLAAFRYHFCTTETRTVTRNGHTTTETYEETHWRQYLIIELASQFPSLQLRPEGLFDKLKGFVGFEDINFESEEFSRKYFCKSDSKEFAYAIIHPQMMEFLMNARAELHLQGQLLLLDLQHTTFDAAGVSGAINLAGGFINRIPDFVWQDYGKATPIKLPPVTYAPPLPTAQS